MRQAIALSRRDFLKAGGSLAAAIAGMSACSLGTGGAGAPDTPISAAAPPAPLSELDAFNYAVGTQTFSPAYQFTSKPRLLETAEATRAMGASAIKFKLGEKAQRGARRAGIQSLRDIAATDPVVRSIFNMPFGHYLLWAYPLATRRNQTSGESGRDEELYDLCCHLLKTYTGTGKSFYLGHWEGDWELRGHAGSRDDPSPQSTANKIGWLNRRQQAVDDAKRDTPLRGVEVFCYAEANKVQDCMKGRPGMANVVIPHTQIDFVSYSSYETSNLNGVETLLPEVLDYLESKLPPKPAIKGKRVWIGEYGYPACRHTPAEQAARTRQVIRAAVQWGCPFVLYWEMYNNELDKDGKQRGFWLIDDKGAKQPVYYLHQRFLQWARAYVADTLKTTHRVPTFDEYRRNAVEYLDAASR